MSTPIWSALLHINHIYTHQIIFTASFTQKWKNWLEMQLTSYALCPYQSSHTRLEIWYSKFRLSEFYTGKCEQHRGCMAGGKVHKSPTRHARSRWNSTLSSHDMHGGDGDLHKIKSSQVLNGDKRTWRTYGLDANVPPDAQSRKEIMKRESTLGIRLKRLQGTRQSICPYIPFSCENLTEWRSCGTYPKKQWKQVEPTQSMRPSGL